MEKNIKKIPAKMRIAIVTSAVWFFFFFILFIGTIGGRRRSGPDESYLLLAIIPLIVCWGIWWVWIEFSKNQNKKQKPAEVDYQNKKQKPAEVKDSSFGVFDSFVASIIISLVIILSAAVVKGFNNIYSILALLIEWIIMSVFLTFFWGSIYGAIVTRYGKKNWKNIYLGTACIMSIVSACVIFAK